MSDVPPRQSPLPIPNRSFTSGSSMNAEEERDHFKEKVEHFKYLVRKLQEENHSYKLRKESTETVSRLLQESKQEVSALQKKCNVFDAIIRTLQSRLESHGLSSDICPHEGEQYIPGQSKMLLDNLTRENKRLRNIIRSRSGDPEEYAKLQQTYEDLEKECNELRIQNSNQQTRIAELEQVLRSSDNEKDRTINELREKVSHVTRELTSRDTLCTTLAEETQLLQKQLEDVAQQCQELAKRLQEQGVNSDNKIVETALKAASKDGPETSKCLTEENKGLKQKLKEITEMNKRWQDFNNQREAYVKTLMTENNDLKTRLEEKTDNQSVQVEMNRILDESRRLLREVEEQRRENTRVLGERDRCRRDLANANGRIAQMHTENQELMRNLEYGVTNDSAETINALKAQIRICTEDFESERKDRERAVAKSSRLEHEVERQKKEIENLRHEVARYQASPQLQTQYTDPFYHYQGGSGPHGNFSNERLAARGVSRTPEAQQYNLDRYNVIDGPELYADGEGQVARSASMVDRDHYVVVARSASKIDKGHDVDYKDDTGNKKRDTVDTSKDMNDDFVSLNASSISSRERSSTSTRDTSPRNSSRGSREESPVHVSNILHHNIVSSSTDVLRCPKCNKEFSSDEHPELLEHMDSCAY